MASKKNRPVWVEKNFGDVEVKWTGAGRYWLSDGVGSLDLGHCWREWQLRKEVRDAIQAGTEDDDWCGFVAAR